MPLSLGPTRARGFLKERACTLVVTSLAAALMLVALGALSLIGGQAARVAPPPPKSPPPKVGLAPASKSLHTSSALPSMFCGHSRLDGRSTAVRPGEIACLSADGSTFLAGPAARGGTTPAKQHPRRITWLRWTAAEAVGRGYLWENTCSPDCSIGKFASYPALIRAFRVRHDKFTRLVIYASGLPQSGDTASLTYDLDLKIPQWLGELSTGQPAPPVV